MVHINYMVEGVNSYVNLFADDAKLSKKVKDNEDCVTTNESGYDIRIE